MSIKLGVVMDPINSINPKKDSTLAMLLAAQKQNWTLFYFTQNDLFLRDGIVYGRAKVLKVKDDLSTWFEVIEEKMLPLSELDVMLMRKDPPFDMEYIYTTHLLEKAQEQGCWVINKPQALRDVNEKLYTAWFPECCPPTLVTRDRDLLLAFLQEQQEVVFKPLEGMGGRSVFRVRLGDLNAKVILEMLTDNGQRFIMAQRFIPAITQGGDKRILMINGEPVSHALARIPAADDTRGNLAAGAIGVGRELTERDRFLCAQVGPSLRAKGLYFVGLDVIGDYITEINVTSPTCIRELDSLFKLDIAGDFIRFISEQLSKPVRDRLK